MDGDPITVSAGESYALESNEPHALENRGEAATVGVAVFSPPRTAPQWPAFE